MDFAHDQTALGRKIPILTIVDTFARFLPAVEPRFRFTGSDVVETFERVGKCYGLPKVIRADQGSDLVSRDLDLWAYQRGVTLDFSRPGKPPDKAFIQTFNGKFRSEGTNAHWFMCLADAAEKCEAWCRDYDEVRPHSAIGNKPPITLFEQSAAHGPRRPEQDGKSSSGCRHIGRRFRTIGIDMSACRRKGSQVIGRGSVASGARPQSGRPLGMMAPLQA